MIIDTHSHLYAKEFTDDIDDVVNRFIQEGGAKVVLPNIDLESVPLMINLSKKFPDIFYNTLGLHPTSVDDDYKNQLEKIFAYDIDIVAVGETGIDLYWDTSYFKQQQESFDYQINYAIDKALPIIIHSRNSFDEVYDIIKMYKSKGLTGVMHCFPGDIEQAKKIVELGLYIGIGGVITYKKNNMEEVVRNIPLDNILIETDAPYLSPSPHRGKRNEPSYLKHIIDKIEQITEKDRNTILNILENNSKKVFKLVW